MHSTHNCMSLFCNGEHEQAIEHMFFSKYTPRMCGKNHVDPIAKTTQIKCTIPERIINMQCFLCFIMCICLCMCLKGMISSSNVKYWQTTVKQPQKFPQNVDIYCASCPNMGDLLRRCNTSPPLFWMNACMCGPCAWKPVYLFFIASKM